MTVRTLAILGAGPAGLAAAYRAAASGHAVTVFEREERVGGLAGSFDVAGISVDHGSHRLHPATEPHLLAELRRLLGADLQERRRHGRIYLEGRWIAFPLQPLDLVRNLPPSFAVAAARDAALGWTRRPSGETFADLLLAGLGPAMCHRFYFPYARKLWGLEPDLIDGEQARRRVSGDAAGKLLRKLTRRGSAGGVFYYPRKGFGQIWEALATAAVKAGAGIRLGCPVDCIERKAEAFRITAGNTAFDADLVWSTLPLPVLCRIFRPEPPADVLRAAGRLRSRAMLLVYLVLPVERYTEFDAHYVPSAATPVSRISEPKNYREGDDPAGRTVLCAEIPCGAGDELWARPDAELGALVVQALAGMGLPQARPTEVVVKRVPAAYPIYDLGYSESFETVAGWAESLTGLLTFGRHGLFVHNNSHHALEMGWAAAGALDEAGFDSAAWDAALGRFAAHVVED
ncbi:MAG TPA: FAD-dependent oxidoreductase [Actinomycetota bacterium]|nr:FAD-dependent oxidoreductase [Actinomycetota bacterium]